MLKPSTAGSLETASPTAVIYLRVSTKEQAERGGEAEGFSIPAQRQACNRKVEALGATVVAEFVDRGESARSANRPELQRLLGYLQQQPVSYVVVHKVDRLARSRADDVMINLAIQQAGARLVSVSENIDETPNGMLLHGIMSSIAEFYSRNLANEVSKGLIQKAEAGGTTGRAPVGFRNVIFFDNGREVRTVELDEQRAPLMRWAFEAYATGDWTLRSLLAELTARGLTTRPTKERPGKALVLSHLARLLKHPYYKGVVVVEYPGRHEPLVSVELWQRRVMTAGSLLAVPATIAIALAPTYAWFLAAWLVAGVAMAAVFYQAAFAALTRWYGDRRVRALTALTLVAGLSSTVFAPLTSHLLTLLDWRGTYLVLAGVLAVVTVPLHALALTPPWRAATTSGAAHGEAPLDRGLPVEVRTPAFLLLSAALTVTAFGLYAASLTLIPLLTGRGFSASLAATTLGLLGAGQLLGRVGYTPLTARTTPTGRTVAIILASAATIGLLAAAPGPPALLVAAAILAGAARGAGTLLQATVVADRWGTARYATLAGFFSAPITAAAALAPWGGTALADVMGSYPAMFGLLAALVFLVAGAVALSSRRPA